MEYARTYLNERVGQKAIDEIQNIKKSDKDHMLFDELIKIITNSEIQKLSSNWKNILDEAPRQTATAVLRFSRPAFIQGNEVTLSCKYAIHKEYLERPESLEFAKNIISDYLGHDCNIKVILESNLPPVNS